VHHISGKASLRAKEVHWVHHIGGKARPRAKEVHWVHHIGDKARPRAKVVHWVHSIKGPYSQCKFGDCRHESESGCAVRAAIEEGELEATRYANYRKTERELARLARKEQSAAARQKKHGGTRDKLYGRKPKHRSGTADLED
jgi:Predicted GTPases